MLFFYRFFINLILILSPLIIVIRLLKKKEDLKRFKEKLCFFSKKKKVGKLIWFHGASVGELQSIVPLLEKFEKNKKIKQILITSNTLSSSKVLNKNNFKKVIHQFFPIDTSFLSKKFLNYWRPSAAFFIDSEIWPNTFINLSDKKIPLILLNARITKKTFNKWMLINNFAHNIFKKINLCLSSSIESEKYLKKLGAKNIKLIGNLKYSQSEKNVIKINYKLKKFIGSKKTWCASSTHASEEIFSGLVHKELKKKYKNLLTIIIPRHINRIATVKEELNNLNLKVHTHEPEKKIEKDTDIYLVNSYGQTKSFYSNCRNVFLGGSIINHGGQNPLEATRYGCNILHGPNVSNFKEIYKHLKKMKISSQISNKQMMVRKLETILKKKSESQKIRKNLKKIGQKILNSTYTEIKFILKNNEV
tara:strand:- start:4072 stop:5328 length:1257 start_codon:yes stop_codon:yes gene_type:complete